MPGPITVRSGQLTDPVLTNLGRRYRPMGAIADIVAPKVPVNKESGKYPVGDSYDFAATDVDPLVPDRAETKEVDLTVGTEGYVCEEYALKASVSRREKENVDDIIGLREAKQQVVQDRLMIAREVRVAALLRKTTNGGGFNLGATPSKNWNEDEGTIEADVKTAIEAIEDATGQDANTIVIPKHVARAIATQKAIREIFKYTVDGRQLLGAGDAILPPEIWGLKVVIAGGNKATNKEGQANAFGRIWGDHVRVMFVNPAPNKETPSAAYTFTARDWETKTWQSDDPEVEYIRPSYVIDEKIVAPDVGYEIASVLS
jgi:hypothetical protein